MSEHERRAPELKAFEALLSGLEPATPKLDRDRLMYEAGRASIDTRGRRGWPVATLCAGLVALVIGRWSADLGLFHHVPFRAPSAPARVTMLVDRNETRLIDDVPVRVPADNSWFVLRATLDGDPAANRAHERSVPSRHPTTATWLEERRLLPDRLN